MAYINNIVLITGQSNADGRVLLSSLPAPLEGFRYKELVWSGSTCRMLNASDENNNQLDTSQSGNYSVEMHLSDYLTAISPRDYYILKSCRGGTALALTGDTNTLNASYGAGGRYELVKTRFDQIQSWMEGRDKLYRISHVIMIQGEADADNAAYAANYQTNYQDIYDGWNTHFAAANTDQGSDPKWIDVRLSSSLARPFVSDVNSAKDALAAANTDFTTINTDDLTFSDGVHYDAASIATLGARIAAEM